ncbi:MAG: AAA family ATPase [Planctomycetota bacterium]|nr:AAA family ATPase [Planctomycetota bacterium]
MNDGDTKLSPAELLAMLKRESLEREARARRSSNTAVHTIPDPTEGDFSAVSTHADQAIRAEPQMSAIVHAARPASHIDQTRTPENSQLSELFNRVNTLLDVTGEEERRVFCPRAPTSLQETGLTAASIERLILKYLYARGQATGRETCAQIRLPFPVVEPTFKQLKQDMLIAFKGAGLVGDYEFVITDRGRDRARRFTEECTYIGATPVNLKDYLKAMSAQSIAKEEATEANLREAFSDLLIDDAMLDRLGPAVNSGRGMFLFGEPGNGKTSIAERITQSFGSTIWIPRALEINGDIVRTFDPGVHEEILEDRSKEGVLDVTGVDQRWVQIVRPTVVAGGELTMAELEITQNRQTKICEAPLQLKSNCGTLVIDDFGRQRMPVDVLLNRWIVPLEKRYDFLNMPSGVKVQVPFDQLIVFSTNLEPKDLVDGAFLRRIPYKIEVRDPSEANFRKLCEIMAPKMGLEIEASAIDYLVNTHYLACKRPFRACQPRDLMLQVRNFCIYKGTPRKLTNQALDFAVENYFSVM